MNLRRLRPLAALALALLLAGCASMPPGNASGHDDDPFEPWNRAMFRANDSFDQAVLNPMLRAYIEHVPAIVRQGVSNFYANLDDAWSVVNDWLQWKTDKAGNDMGRVMINSFFGLGGLIDIASDAGIERGNEDFGQTLGYWGVPQGPYLFVPLIGPSTVRDGSGIAVRGYLGPLAWIDDTATRSILYAIGYGNARALALQSQNLVSQAALDRYTFLRSAYLQRRAYLVRDGQPEPIDKDSP